jgi:hypothetical protein
MATLTEILDEQARIKSELQRMEDSEETTEENDGDLRDTLVARWEQLDAKAKPLIERMERVRGITRAAADPANLEPPDAGGSRWGAELVTRTHRDPYENLDAVRSRIVTRADLKARALDAVELEAKRGSLSHDYAETATIRAQENPGVARHMLLTGSEEYQQAFQAYIEDPEGNAQRTALSLSNSNGGYLLPFVLDQMVA